MNFTAYIHNDEDGGFWAQVPELPGSVTQGDTEEELEANLKEVIELYLEGFIEDYVEGIKDPVPPEPPDFKWTMSLDLTVDKARAKSKPGGSRPRP